MWIGSAITGLFSTSSTVIGLPWKTAPGWAHALVALMHRDPRQSCGVVAEFGGVALRDLRVRAVLADVAVRDLELGLRRAVVVARRPVPAEGLPGPRFRPRDFRRARHHDEHRLALSQLDRRGGPPHHARRGRTAQVDPVAEVQRQPQILRQRGRREQVRLGDAVRRKPVHHSRIHAGVLDHHLRQPGILVQRERRRRGLPPFGGQLRDADDRRLATQTRHDESRCGRATVAVPGISTSSPRLQKMSRSTWPSPRLPVTTPPKDSA